MSGLNQRVKGCLSTTAKAAEQTASEAKNVVVTSGKNQKPIEMNLQYFAEDTANAAKKEVLGSVDDVASDVIKGGSGSKVLNNKGVPYPEVEVNGYGKVELPSGPYEPNNSKLLRPQFTDSYKKQFKEWWTEQGRPWPEGEVNIHHLKPLSKGGDNSFENLVPLIQPVEHQPFTNWWRSFPE